MRNNLIVHIKLVIVIVFVSLGGILLQDFTAAAHDGHGHRHAPASARRLKSPVSNTPENVEAGRALYEENCASCHGMDGKARTETAARMKKRPTDLTSHAMHSITSGEVYWVVTNGIAASKMPDYRRLLTPKARWQTTLYVLSLKDERAASSAHSTDSDINKAAWVRGLTTRPDSPEVRR